MSDATFLNELEHTARKVADLPSTHGPLTGFFWAHAWLFWLAAALLSALVYESFQGRCP